MTKEKFIELLDKYLKGELSEEEEKKLQNYYSSFQASEQWDPALGNEEELEHKLLEKINKGVQRSDADQNRRILFPWLKVAAAVLLLCVCTALFLIHRKNTAGRPGPARLVLNQDREPAGDHAVLTLADHSKIVLDKIAAGQVIHQGAISITKTADGQLVYHVRKQTKADDSAGFNTITTPRGGKFKILLSDGSMVWLNAASSLRFPANFSKKERRVILSGEAYFEIAKILQPGLKKHVPFFVNSSGQEIEVFGTHFNVNTYSNEEVSRTTLLEGSVRVSDLLTHAAKMLKPGQQAVRKPQGGKMEVSDADVEQAIAWQNGYFNFRHTELKEIMKELERWYNVNVSYQGTIPENEFTGYISRKVKLSNVLKMLEQGGGIKFSIDSKAVYVKPDATD